MAKELNHKQKQFVEEYIISGNATDAAVKAGYSKKTAYSLGERLLKKAEVQEYMEGAIKALQNEKILKQDEILVILSEIAKGQAKEYKEVVTKKGEWMTNPNSAEGKQQLVYNENSEIIELPTKNSDRVRALELLGKRYTMWIDKQQVEDVTPRFIEDVPDDDDEE